MLFASFDFLLFIVPVLAIYWWLSGREFARLSWILVASYFFYMSSARPSEASLPAPWYYAGLLLFSTVLDFVCAGAIARRAGECHDPNPQVAGRARRVRATLLLLSLVGNLGLLGYFKYTNFLIEVAQDIAGLLGSDWAVQPLELALPIGISFYTFQSLSYTIDVWRGRLQPEASFLRFSAFVVFFPQLVAGPIVRASEFLPQLRHRPQMEAGRVPEGCFRIWKGLVKKVVLGDFIAVAIVDPVFAAPTEHSSLELLLALYGFTLQIYADFSGYSDIAIGVAMLMGFRLPENFDRPNQAQSIGEFWRRWHMTLSTWLRDYLFFPLGGSRVGPARAYFNLWLTMFLVGMWHDASWNFVIYANLQALAMLVNRWNRVRDHGPGRTSDGLRGWWSFAGFTLALWALALLVGAAILKLNAAHCGLICVGSCLAFWLVCKLPLPRPGEAGQSRWLGCVHVLLTFHFTVFSRVFFRAEDLGGASIFITELLDWDGLGVRDGWFRVQGLADAMAALDPGALPYVWLMYPLSEYGVALVLVAGLAYHFTPKSWIDRGLGRLFAQLPAFVVALVFVLTMLILGLLLDGPRANIYFEF